MTTSPTLPMMFKSLRFAKREGLRFLPEYRNPFPELISASGARYSMETMTAGTSAENARSTGCIEEVVERFVDHGTDWTLTARQMSDQIGGIATTIRSFLGQTVGDEPVLIGLYKTGLSDEALVQSLFNGKIRLRNPRKRQFNGRLSYRMLGQRTIFNIDRRIQWTSAFVRDRSNLAASEDDCDWVVLNRRVDEEQHGRWVWKENRVYPVARYGEHAHKPIPRFSLPLALTAEGKVLVTDNGEAGQLLDRNGVFDGTVLRVTIFSKVAWPTLEVVPNNSLHIQLSRSGLVCSIGTYTGFFGYFSRDISKLLEIFRAGGAE